MDNGYGCAEPGVRYSSTKDKNGERACMNQAKEYIRDSRVPGWLGFVALVGEMSFTRWAAGWTNATYVTYAAYARL